MDVVDLDITTVTDGGVVTVKVSGEVDIANAGQLRAAGLQALDTRPGELVIDLSAVTFMDSAGLGQLIRVLRAARSVPTRVLVSHQAVVRLFHMTGLASAFTVKHVA